MPIAIYEGGDKFNFEGTVLQAVENKARTCNGCFFNSAHGCEARSTMFCNPVELREYAVKFIEVKEPEYRPFDGTKPEVQDFLLGKKIVAKDDSLKKIIDSIEVFSLGRVFFNGYSAEELFKDFVFMDGSPVGEEVTEL